MSVPPSPLCLLGHHPHVLPESSRPGTAQATPAPCTHCPGESQMLKYWATAWQAQEEVVKGMLCQICVIYQPFLLFTLGVLSTLHPGDGILSQQQNPHHSSTLSACTVVRARLLLQPRGFRISLLTYFGCKKKYLLSSSVLLGRPPVVCKD